MLVYIYCIHILRVQIGICKCPKIIYFCLYMMKHHTVHFIIILVLISFFYIMKIFNVLCQLKFSCSSKYSEISWILTYLPVKMLWSIIAQLYIGKYLLWIIFLLKKKKSHINLKIHFLEYIYIFEMWKILDIINKQTYFLNLNFKVKLCANFIELIFKLHA